MNTFFNNMPLYQISVNLGNIRFWDYICPKKMSDKNFERINIKIVISTQQIYQSTKFQSSCRTSDYGNKFAPKNWSDKIF